MDDNFNNNSHCHKFVTKTGYGRFMNETGPSGHIPKHIVIFCDGTWQGVRQPIPTNVGKLYKARGEYSRDGGTQVHYYQAGIGANVKHVAHLIPNLLQPVTKTISRLGSGMFGWGLSDKVTDAYKHVCRLYEPGDVIDIVGFSRGAYTARSLAGMIYKCGILKEKHPTKAMLDEAFDFYKNRTIRSSDFKAMAWRAAHSHPDKVKNSRRSAHLHTIPDVRIGILGLFETVGAHGLPVRLPFATRWNERYKFHDTKVNPLVEHVVHLVAGHEDSDLLEWMPVNASKGADTKIHQIIMPGNHSAVGGGSALNQGISDFAGRIMAEALEEYGGVGFDKEKLNKTFNKADPYSRINDDFGPRLIFSRPKTRSGLGEGDWVHPSVFARAVHPSRLPGAVRLPPMIDHHYPWVRTQLHIDFADLRQKVMKDKPISPLQPSQFTVPQTNHVSHVRLVNGRAVEQRQTVTGVMHT